MRTNKSRNIKIQLSTFFLAFTALIPATYIRSKARFPIDPFKRYWGQIIPEKIAETGAYESTMFPQHSELLIMANSQIHNPQNYILITISHLVSGLGVDAVHFIPLYTIPLILTIGLIARRISGSEKVFFVATILSLGYQFRVMQWFSAAHQGYLVWYFFFSILLFLLITRKQTNPYTTVGLLLLATGFVLSDHTVPLTALSFFTVLYISDKVLSTDLFSFKLFSLILSIVVLNYGIISSWLTGSAVTLLVNISGSSSTGIGLTSFLVTSGNIHPDLAPYRVLLGREHPIIYRMMAVFSSVSAVILFGIATFKRIYNYVTKSQDSYNTVGNTLLIAFISQLIFYASSTVFFAYSGGIDPTILGLFVAPIFAAPLIVPVSRLELTTQGRKKTMAVLLIVVIVIAAPIVTTFWRAQIDANGPRNLSDSSIEEINWYIEHQNPIQTTVSDLNTLSYYHALGGRGPTFLPSGPDLSSDTVVNQMINTYYTNPEESYENSDVYITNSIMSERAISNRGGLKTAPNPNLNRQLSGSPKWQKVYHSNKDDNVYIAVETERG